MTISAKKDTITTPIEPEKQPENPWSEHTSDDGRKYYYNSETKNSVWEKPDELKTEEEKIRDTISWKEHKTGDGKIYYYNHVTKETTWDCPPDMAEVLKKIAYLKGVDLDEKHRQIDDKYSTLEEAKAAFKALLRDCNVPSNATWDVVTKMTNTDPRFTALKQVNEKKKVFNTYKQVKANEEKLQERLRNKENREKLKAFLEENPLMNSYTRYSKAARLFKTFEVWSAVTDRERRDVLDEVQPLLSRREREADKEAAKNNQKSFIKFLRKYPDHFGITTKWIDALEIIKNEDLTARYSKIHEILDNEKEDALIGFESYVTQFEEAYEKEQTVIKYQERKVNRLNRDQFTDWLLELYNQSVIDKNSKWKKLWPILKVDARTLALMRQPGSSPLDLFKFFIHNLKGKHGDKKIIKKLIKTNSIQLSNNTSFEEFFELVNNKSELNKMEKISAKASFEIVRDKLLAREVYKRLRNDKNHKSLCHDFYNMMKLLEPPLKQSTKWNEIWPHLTQEPEYINLQIESERLRIFKKFVKKIDKKPRKSHSKESRHKNDKKSENSSSSEDDDDTTTSHKRRHSESVHLSKHKLYSSPSKKKTIYEGSYNSRK